MQKAEKKNLSCNTIVYGPDHLQLTLLNWETESVLALNKKLKVNWKNSVFDLVPKHFCCPN